MDYETIPTSRAELRLFSKLFRSICSLSPDEPINPIALLDRLPDLEGFEDVRYEVVNNNVLPGAVPAKCEMFRAVPRGLAKNRGDFSLRFLLVYACDTSMHFIRVLFCCISTAPLDVPLFLTGFRDHQIEVPAYNLRLQMPTKMKDHLPAKEFL